MSPRQLFRTVRYILNHPLNRESQLKALIRYARWQLGSRLTGAQTLVPWIDNTFLLVSSGETGITQNVYCGLHEFAEMAFLLHFLKPEDLFFDAGANAGVYSVLAGGCCGSPAIAIEPVPATYVRLKRQLLVNGLQDKVEARNVGLGSTDAQLYFSTDRDTMNRIVAPDWIGPKELIPVTTIDRLCASVPALIKIDVEGFDAQVLNGASRVLENDRLQAVIIEISEASKKILSNYGFAPFQYNPFSRKLTASSWEDDCGANTIVIRGLESVSKRLASAPKRLIHGKSI